MDIVEIEVIINLAMAIFAVYYGIAAFDYTSSKACCRQNLFFSHQFIAPLRKILRVKLMPVKFYKSRLAEVYGIHIDLDGQMLKRARGVN